MFDCLNEVIKSMKSEYVCNPGMNGTISVSKDKTGVLRFEEKCYYPSLVDICELSTGIRDAEKIGKKLKES